jgi:hypothetical protein
MTRTINTKDGQPFRYILENGTGWPTAEEAHAASERLHDAGDYRASEVLNAYVALLHAGTTKSMIARLRELRRAHKERKP